METKEALQAIREYNQSLSMRSCSSIEQAFINGIEERNDYFYGFRFGLDLNEQHVEDFLRSQKWFRGLLKEHGEQLCTYLTHVQEYSCNTNYIRMDVRSSDFRKYEQRVMSGITAFYLFYGAGLDIKALIYGEYRQLFYNMDFSSVIASELFENNAEVIQYCKDVLLSENNTAVLTRAVIIAIEKSQNEELWELLKQLLVAAALQEGLRQSILETADEYQLGCFMKLQECIVEKNLLRFSSVQRSVLTWIGIGFDLVKEKDVKLIFNMIYQFYRDETKRKEALEKDPLQAYLALYVQGAMKVERAMIEAKAMLGSKERFMVASALVYLKLTMQFDCITYRDFLVTYKDDEWIMALYLSELSRIREIKANKQDAMELFDHVEQIISQYKATQTYTSTGFSWFSVVVQKSSVANVLYQLLMICKTPAYVERFLSYVSMSLLEKELDAFMKTLFPLAGMEAKKAFLLKEIISTNKKLQAHVEQCYLHMSLTAEDIEKLEERLNSKNAKARASIVNILAAQPHDQVMASYERLCASNQKVIQDSALELKQKASQVFEKSEAIRVQIPSRESGYGFYEPQKTYTYQSIQKLPMTKKGLFKKESVDLSKLYPLNERQFLAYLLKWNERIQAMKDMEYQTSVGYRQVKDGYLYPLNYQERSISALPFADIWEKYIKEDGLQNVAMFQVCFLLEALHDEESIASYLHCPGFFTLRYMDVKDKVPYLELIERIHQYYRMGVTLVDTNHVLAYWELLLFYSNSPHYTRQYSSGAKMLYAVSSLRSSQFILSCFNFLSCSDQEFLTSFPIYAQGYGKFHMNCSKEVVNRFCISPLVLTRALMLGCINKSQFLEQLLDTHEPLPQYAWSGNHNQSQLYTAYAQAYFEGRGMYGKPHFDIKEYRSVASKEVILQLRALLDEVASFLLSMEETRLNDETPVTALVKQLRIVNGVEHLLQALRVVDQEELKRHEGGDDRVSVFTDILRHCYPISSQANAQRLKEAHVSEKRLVEVAMLAPQWISIINEVLEWDGFQDACYYFIAHMKSYDYQQKKAEIARFTDLEPEDLNDGAIDIDWCKRIYASLGDKRFQMIYQAAKFLCENSFHTRARKYADACLSLVDKESLWNQAKEKRNKDALNAYCIVPLENDQDLLARYIYVQQFIKETRKFGSQRQASEKRSAQMALTNLARNSRFETMTRLSWMMESQMITQYAHYLSPQSIQDVEVWIQIDEQGHNELRVSKKGKTQKSIPAALKKNETILEMKEVHQQWNEQYRRSRMMLQQAMEERTTFGIEEIQVMAQNPIVSVMLSKLVLINNETLGFYQDGKLKGLQGSISIQGDIRIAHTYDLYHAGVWAQYQTYIFDQQIIQPFKQVFRELYLKLEDELESTSTKRYSGYQIQPKKAAAALKSRKWNVSYESGLERIYYKEDLVVNLYADADWFSPSDIEAPSIDDVGFSARKNDRVIKIKDIDDIIFSEIMRDIDLAVSTAYVGGVDPTTSFSTMELRSTIISYTCKLMKLANVEVTGHFANIKGVLNDYSVHLGSGVIHQSQGGALHIVPVFSGQRGKVYLPFLDEDPKSAEILSKVVLLAEDGKIKDPSILSQIITRK